MQTGGGEQHGDVKALDVHRFELGFCVEVLPAREIDHITAGVAALAADHAHIMRQRRALLARLFAVDQEQIEIAARRHAHGTRRRGP